MTINGKEYELRSLELGDIVAMEKMGVKFDEDMTFTAISALFAVEAKISLDKATKILNDHIVATGDLSVIEELSGVVENSPFFKALAKKAE